MYPRLALVKIAPMDMAAWSPPRAAAGLPPTIVNRLPESTAAAWQAQHHGAALVGVEDVLLNQPVPAWTGSATVVAVIALQFMAPHIRRLVSHSLRPQKCRGCFGVGHNLCDYCKGRGKNGGLFTATELVACATCSGRGHQLCDTCRGTGLRNHWRYKTPKDVGWGPRGES